MNAIAEYGAAFRLIRRQSEEKQKAEMSRDAHQTFKVGAKAKTWLCRSKTKERTTTVTEMNRRPSWTDETTND